jgi:hypothetical protein
MEQLGLVWDRPSLAEAVARRDDGIQRAVDHAEAEEPGWCDLAFGFLQAFAQEAAEPFLAEAVVEAAYGIVPPPPDGRAWGGIFQKASRRQVIRRVGYAPARTSNASAKPLWVGVREQ